MNKNEVFWISHLIEAACGNIGVEKSQLKKLAAHMRIIGNMSNVEVLTKLSKRSNADIAKQIKPYILESADTDDYDEVDEGEIGYHNNIKYMTENHPNEVTNEYALFSVPAAFK